MYEKIKHEINYLGKRWARIADATMDERFAAPAPEGNYELFAFSLTAFERELRQNLLMVTGALPSEL